MIHLEHYLLRIQSIETQYDYAREAIRGFIESTNPSKLEAKPSMDELMLKALSDVNDENFIQHMNDYMRSIKGNFPEDQKDLENRLAQNEVILMVAVFEDMLKSIYREVLRQKPKLLDPESKRTIPVGKLAALGESKIIEEEIESAVQALDRKTPKLRAKEFERIGLPWNIEVETIEQILNLRNKILHEDIEKEVTGWDLSDARHNLLLLPVFLCWEGSRLYPAGFQVLPEMLTQRGGI